MLNFKALLYIVSVDPYMYGILSTILCYTTDL